MVWKCNWGNNIHPTQEMKCLQAWDFSTDPRILTSFQFGCKMPVSILQELGFEMYLWPAMKYVSMRPTAWKVAQSVILLHWGTKPHLKHINIKSIFHLSICSCACLFGKEICFHSRQENYFIFLIRAECNGDLPAWGNYASVPNYFCIFQWDCHWYVKPHSFPVTLKEFTPLSPTWISICCFWMSLLCLVLRGLMMSVVGSILNMLA